MSRLLFLWFLLLSATAEAIPVVPGAVGFGMDTRAAYACGSNPTIIRVTSLADTNTLGTLRYAMLQTGPRVIIFETSGYIDIGSSFDVVSPCMTIAGQTAPSPGITVRMTSGFTDKLIVINTHDVLIQHIRFRPGDSSCNSGPLVVYSYLDTGDGNGVIAHALFYNVVFDHVSVSWGQDEGLYAGATDVNSGNSNVTFWRTIAAEGLYAAPGSSGCGGGGSANGHGIFSEGAKVDIIQSLMSTNRERNPMLDGGFSTRLLNNIIYDWQGEWGVFTFNKAAHPGPWYLSAVGNRFIAGPATNSNTGVGGAVVFWWGTASPTIGVGDSGDQSYRLDNTVTDSFSGTFFTTNNLLSYNPDVGTPPSQAPIPSGYTPIASGGLEAFLLPKLGARPADRDSVDTRIIANVKNRTGPSTGSGYVSQVSDVGGYPTLAVNTRTLTTPTNPHNDDNGNGYTNLEEWLQGYAQAVEDGPANGPADVPAATGTIIVSDVFTGSTNAVLTSGHTGGTGATWALQTGSTSGFALDASNRLMSSLTTNTATLTYASGTPLTSQYDVDVDMVVLTLVPGNSYSVWAGIDPVTVTGIGFGFDVSSMVFSLFNFVNGTQTQTGSCLPTITAGNTYHITLRKRTAGQHGVIDNVQCTSTTDNSVSAAGKAGLSTYLTTADTTTTGIHFDNLVVHDVTTAPSGCSPKCRFRFGVIH